MLGANEFDLLVKWQDGFNMVLHTEGLASAGPVPRGYEALDEDGEPVPTEQH